MVQAPNTGQYTIKANGATRFLALPTKFGIVGTDPNDVSNNAKWQVFKEDSDFVTLRNTGQLSYAKSIGVEGTNILGDLSSTVWGCEKPGPSQSFRFKVNFTPEPQYLSMDNANRIKLAPLDGNLTQLWDLTVA